MERLRKIGFSKLTPLDEALELLFSQIYINPVEKVEVINSLNRVLAKGIISEINIPPFDRSNKLHMALSRAAAHAEQVASAVQLSEGMHFITARKKIRAALDEDGITQKIDKLVAELLEGNAITP